MILASWLVEHVVVPQDDECYNAFKHKETPRVLHELAIIMFEPMRGQENRLCNTYWIVLDFETSGIQMMGSQVY